MKLAILGVVVVALGAVLGVDGLLLTGGLWLVLGVALRLIGAGGEQEAASVDGATFARRTAMILAVGVPSLAIGLLAIGFADPDRAWRWLPVAIGAWSTGIAIVSVVGYLTGSGLAAVAEARGVPDQPATVTIRAMRETGVYVNGRPRLELELHVAPEGAAAYEVTKRATVPFTAMGSLRVGAGFRALVLPGRPKRMEIDWGAPVSAAAAARDPAQRLELLERLRRDGDITAAEYEQQRRRILEAI